MQVLNQVSTQSIQVTIRVQGQIWSQSYEALVNLTNSQVSLHESKPCISQHQSTQVLSEVSNM